MNYYKSKNYPVNFTMISTITIVLILISLNIILSQSLVVQDEINNSKLTNYAITIYKDHCKECKTLLLIFPEDDVFCNHFIKSFSQEDTLLLTIEMTNYTVNPVGYDEDFYKPEFTIMILTGFSNNLEAVIFGIEEYNFWNIRGKFLIVLTDDTGTSDWVEESFQFFWEKQVLRVIISYLDINGELKIYSFNPFRNESLIDLSKENIPKNYNKITNMYGNPLRLYNFDLVLRENVKKIIRNGKVVYIGIDGKYFNLLAEVLNASLIVHNLSEDFDESTILGADTNMPLGKYINIFIELFDFDLFMNVLRIYSDNELDKIYLNERSDVFIMIPSGKIIPHYYYIFLIVPYDVWSAMFLSLFLITVAMKVMRNNMKKKRNFRLIFNDNLRLLMNSPIPEVKRNLKEKMLLILWIFHCIVITLVFQSILTSTLIIPKYYPVVDTLEELYQTDIMVSIYYSYYYVKYVMK